MNYMTTLKITNRDLGFALGGAAIGGIVAAIGSLAYARKGLAASVEATEVYKMMAMEASDSEARWRELYYGQLGYLKEELVGYDPDDPDEDDFEAGVYVPDSVTVGTVIDELEAEEAEDTRLEQIVDDEEFDAVTVTREQRPEIEDWDWDVELARREQLEIYPLHRDEYCDGESGLEQQEVIYFAKDGVFTDQYNRPFDVPTAYVGTDIEWGHGSGDPELAYIRNERLEVEYEINYDPGSYAEEYLGVLGEMDENEAKHALKSKRIRMV